MGPACTTRSARSGAGIVPEGEWGHLPVVVDARAVWPAGRVAMPGDVSSQFVTALMLVAPATAAGIEIELTTPLVSRPYLGITAAVMACLRRRGRGGGGARSVRVATGPLPPRRLPGRAGRVVGLVPVGGGGAHRRAGAVPGFGPAPLQGDVAFVDCWRGWARRSSGARTASRSPGTGRLHGVDVDMRDCSDTVPTLAAVAAFADSPTRITGVGFIRTKETDRIGSLVAELARCGVDADGGARRTGRSGRGPSAVARRRASARTTTTAWPWRWRCSACASRASRSTTRTWWRSRSPASGRPLGRPRRTPG